MLKKFFFLGLVLAMLGCGKEDPCTTIINGTVTDRKTGVPIEGAVVRIGGVRPGADNGLDEYFSPYNLNTDASGSFKCILERGDYSSSDISSSGYITNSKPLQVVNGQENNISVTLAPRDGFLKLKIENQTGLKDTLYASVFSPTVFVENNGFYGSQVIKTYPLLLKKGEVYIEIMDLASPEAVDIRWGFHKPTYQIPYTQRYSISISAKDTVTYILAY